MGNTQFLEPALPCAATGAAAATIASSGATSSAPPTDDVALEVTVATPRRQEDADSHHPRLQERHGNSVGNRMLRGYYKSCLWRCGAVVPVVLWCCRALGCGGRRTAAAPHRFQGLGFGVWGLGFGV